jgi:hypothetical protein
VSVIWKFPIEVADAQIVQMPLGAKILTAQMQRDQLCLWALVDPAAPIWPMEIAIIGTGHEARLARGMEYVATVQELDGALVWHVFASTLAAIRPKPAHVPEKRSSGGSA